MKFLVILLTLIFNSQSFAQESTAKDAALNIHDNIVTNFSNEQLDKDTQDALNNLVEYAAQELEQRGFAQDAAQARSEWNKNYSTYFISGQWILDLGDHAPLSQWLGDFYKKLRLRLGDQVVSMLNLVDINTLNYALPVVFRPNGDKKNNESWDALEYSKHFVPFAAIVTYWGSLYGCKYATKTVPNVNKYCKQIASILRNGMTNWIAPKLSNYVYNVAVKAKKDKLEIDLQAIRKRYESQIASLNRKEY